MNIYRITYRHITRKDKYIMATSHNIKELMDELVLNNDCHVTTVITKVELLSTT
jgi:hypothetical protein